MQLVDYKSCQWRIHIRAPTARRPPSVLRITVITHGRQNVGDPIRGAKEGSLCPTLMWFVHFRYICTIYIYNSRS